MTQPFPTKEHPQACVKGCGTQIYLSKKSGKYLPYEIDDALHDCQNKPKQGPNGHDLSIDVLLQRLEQLGITIDLGKLRLVK